MGVLKLEVFNKDNDSEFKKDYINTIGGEVPSEENIKHAAEH